MAFSKKYDAPISWSNLLLDAVQTPGKINPAFRQFHNYSMGNIMLMAFQCLGMGINPGPIRTYNQWKKLNRNVKSGAKAIILCQPRIWKKKEKNNAGKEVITPITIFEYYKRWFVLDQTEGEDIEIPNIINSWNKEKALSKLGISIIPFDNLDGNTLGYAKAKSIAISPLVDKIEYFGTLLHEIAHVILGHTLIDGNKIIESTDRMPRTIKEVEAESVAYLLLDTLDMKDNLAYSRDYIQNWLHKHTKEDAIPDYSANRIFKAANKILQAGLPETVEDN